MLDTAVGDKKKYVYKVNFHVIIKYKIHPPLPFNVWIKKSKKLISLLLKSIFVDNNMIDNNLYSLCGQIKIV